MPKADIPAPIRISIIHGVTCLTRPDPNQYIPAGAVYEALRINPWLESMGCARHALRVEVHNALPISYWRITAYHLTTGFYAIKSEYIGMLLKPHNDRKIRVPVWDHARRIAQSATRPPMDRQTWRTHWRLLRSLVQYGRMAKLPRLHKWIIDATIDRLMPIWDRMLRHKYRIEPIIMPGSLPPILVDPPAPNQFHFLLVGELDICRMLGLDVTTLSTQAAIQSMLPQEEQR